MSEHCSKEKNNRFQFCENEKHTTSFIGINFEYFHIYENKKLYFSQKIP